MARQKRGALNFQTLFYPLSGHSLVVTRTMIAIFFSASAFLFPGKKRHTHVGDENRVTACSRETFEICPSPLQPPVTYVRNTQQLFWKFLCHQSTRPSHIFVSVIARRPSVEERRLFFSGLKRRKIFLHLCPSIVHILMSPFSFFSVNTCAFKSPLVSNFSRAPLHVALRQPGVNVGSGRHRQPR